MRSVISHGILLPCWRAMDHRMRNLLATLMVALGLAVAGLPARGADLTVFAAASLKEALDEQVGRFEAETGGKIVVSYAASSALAKQIESGAPADVFLSADVDWLDYLDQRKRIRGGTRINLLRNRLVLIAPADSRAALRIAPGFELAAALGTGRLAMANPDGVPAGKYGRDSLRALNVSRAPKTCALRWFWSRAARRLSASCTRPMRPLNPRSALSIRSRRIRTHRSSILSRSSRRAARLTRSASSTAWHLARRELSGHATASRWRISGYRAEQHRIRHHRS